MRAMRRIRKLRLPMQIPYSGRERELCESMGYRETFGRCANVYQTKARPDTWCDKEREGRLGSQNEGSPLIEASTRSPGDLS